MWQERMGGGERGGLSTLFFLLFYNYYIHLKFPLRVTEFLLYITVKYLPTMHSNTNTDKCTKMYYLNFFQNTHIYLEHKNTWWILQYENYKQFVCI